MESQDKTTSIPRAEELRKAQQFAEALTVYRELWTKGDAQEKRNILFGISYCLYKTKDYQALIGLYRTLNEPGSLDAPTKNNFAWALYYHYIKSADYSKPEQLVEVIEEISALVPPSRGLCASTFSILTVLKHAEKKLSPQLQVFLCEKLDPNLLESVPVPVDDSGKTFPSQQEDYYVIYSKALHEAESYSACVDICKLALTIPISWHNDQDIWMRRRLANCYLQLKLFDPALEEMTVVSKRKRDWFISHELAEIYFQKGDLPNARRLAENAATAYGNPEMKINLWALLYGIYQSTEPELASILLRLQLAIVFQKHWKISAGLSKAAYTHNLKAENLPNYNLIYKELLAKLKPGTSPGPASDKTRPSAPGQPQIPQGRIEGTIKKILPHGNAGFIQTSSGDYFFGAGSLRFPLEDLKEGLKVSFRVIKSFDPVKNLPSTKAVELELRE